MRIITNNIDLQIFPKEKMEISNRSKDKVDVYFFGSLD